MVADKFEGKLGYVNKRNPFGGPPPLEGRSHLHRGIFDSSLARSVITPGITTRENFSSTSGGSTEWCMVAAEKSEAAEQTRKGAGASARASALPPRDVVKYVAIYTGDWRHWRLGSERVRAPPPFPPFLALSPGLPNFHPSACPDRVIL